MRVVITGGTGFLGLLLAQRLIARGTLTGASGRAEPVEEIILFDVARPPVLPGGFDGRVEIVLGDIADPARLRALIAGDSVSVFHLASVVSAGAEQDFDLALKVNLQGGLALFEACRALPRPARLVFTSSIAVFGGDRLPQMVTDDTKITPRTTYGMTKAALELLVNDRAPRQAQPRRFGLRQRRVPRAARRRRLCAAGRARHPHAGRRLSHRGRGHDRAARTAARGARP
jgi:nucleoside-diphosphate-sugar epimerase